MIVKEPISLAIVMLLLQPVHQSAKQANIPHFGIPWNILRVI
jgi:hypothetical protein